LLSVGEEPQEQLVHDLRLSNRRRCGHAKTRAKNEKTGSRRQLLVSELRQLLVSELPSDDASPLRHQPLADPTVGSASQASFFFEDLFLGDGLAPVNVPGVERDADPPAERDKRRPWEPHP
jgi:hypothetical protein